MDTLVVLMVKLIQMIKIKAGVSVRNVHITRKWYFTPSRLDNWLFKYTFQLVRPHSVHLYENMFTNGHEVTKYALKSNF